VIGRQGVQATLCCGKRAYRLKGKEAWQGAIDHSTGRTAQQKRATTYEKKNMESGVVRLRGDPTSSTISTPKTPSKGVGLKKVVRIQGGKH